MTKERGKDLWEKGCHGSPSSSRWAQDYSLDWTRQVVFGMQQQGGRSRICIYGPQEKNQRVFKCSLTLRNYFFLVKSESLFLKITVFHCPGGDSASHEIEPSRSDFGLHIPPSLLPLRLWWSMLHCAVVLWFTDANLRGHTQLHQLQANSTRTIAHGWNKWDSVAS